MGTLQIVPNNTNVAWLTLKGYLADYLGFYSVKAPDHGQVFSQKYIGVDDGT